MSKKETDRTVQMRNDNSVRFRREQIAKGQYKQVNIGGKTDDINKLNSGLAAIEGGTKLEKLLFLLDFYQKITTNQAIND